MAVFCRQLMSYQKNTGHFALKVIKSLIDWVDKDGTFMV
jgi:hypothetical protein